MAVLPCFLCGNKLEQRTAKNGKPYFVCDPCGTQFFVRRKQGIEKLKRLIRTIEKHRRLLGANAGALFQIRTILDELAGIEDEIHKLDDSVGIFSKPSKEKTETRKLLKQRMQSLLDELERIAA